MSSRLYLRMVLLFVNEVIVVYNLYILMNYVFNFANIGKSFHFYFVMSQISRTFANT